MRRFICYCFKRNCCLLLPLLLLLSDNEIIGLLSMEYDTAICLCTLSVMTVHIADCIFSVFCPIGNFRLLCCNCDSNLSFSFFILLHCALAAVQCIVICPVCGWMGVCVCESVNLPR